MTRRPIFWLLLSASVMLLIPWVIVTFVRSDGGMLATLLLLFIVDPGYCIFAGYYAGKRIRHLWWVPAVSAAAFLAGTWLLFEMGEPAFLTYAGICFALGMEAMLVSRLITGRRENDG